MEKAANFVLYLYRAARDTPSQEFPVLARRMLRAVTGSDGPPPTAAAAPPQNHPDLGSRDEAPSAELAELLEIHVHEALRLNHTLRGSCPGSGTAPGCRALVSARGELLYCTQRFAALLGCAQSRRLPPELTKRLLRGRTARLMPAAVEVTPVQLGDAWLLTAEEIPLHRRLTPRELVVARRFGAGQSSRAIAADLNLAQATVRNMVRSIYHKLDINDKAALARLLLTEIEEPWP